MNKNWNGYVIIKDEPSHRDCMGNYYSVPPSVKLLAPTDYKYNIYVVLNM